MDLNLEDVITVVRFILDYVGIDVDDWLSTSNFNWEQWRRNIRHRNLVRLIGSYLINTKVRRINFQPQLISEPRPDAIESAFYMTSNSIVDADDDDDDDDGDRVWVEEEMEDGCIEIRPRHRNDLTIASCDTILRHQPARTSTPLSMCHPDRSLAASQCGDTQATAKISALEDELIKLREQIAAIVLNQEQQSLPRPVGPNDVTLDTTKSRVDQTNQHDVVSCVPPMVPPPPPLPPLPPTNTAERGDGETRAIERPSRPVTMCDVLRDIGNVKLRSVQRSPGGTPIRRPPRLTQSTDPAALIASALRKKFAHRRIALGSPTTDKENSPELTPTSPFGHMLKKGLRSKTSERRSSGLCAYPENGCPVMSPLTNNVLQ